MKRPLSTSTPTGSRRGRAATRGTSSLPREHAPDAIILASGVYGRDARLRLLRVHAIADARASQAIVGLLDRIRSAALSAQAAAARSDPEAEARRLIDEGNAQEDQGRVDEAMELYDEAIRLAPALARAHMNRGNVLLAKGDAQRALDAYAQALRHDPDYAAAHFNAGNALVTLHRLDEAHASYQEAIARKPDFADAEVALGGVCEARGQFDLAIAAYRRALAIDPGYAEVHGNLGNALRKKGLPDEATASYRQALALKPGIAWARYQLGHALRDLRRHDDAIACYREVLQDKPDFAEAHCSLAEALNAIGHVDEAIAEYGRGLELEPELALAHNNLGNIWQNAGKLDEAVASYRRALALRPDYADVLGNLGNALHGLGMYQDAETSLRRALDIDPGLAFAHYNLGIVYYDLGRLHDAAACFRHALKIDPEYVDARCNLGNALHGLGQFQEALDCYRRVLQTDPGYALAYSNIGNTLKDLGSIDEAVANCERALELKPAMTFARSNLLFLQNFRAGYDPGRMLAEARRYGDVVAAQAHAFDAWPNDPAPDRKLRVGFVSGDLRSHAAGHFVEGVAAALASVASDALEIYGYHNHVTADAMTERIRASCRGWFSAAGVSDERLVQRIRDDRIDVLIDLSGHTAANRLPVFAWKPAPVQATWLGYFATTGVAAIDYLIADPWTLPASEDGHFTEKIWRLPHTRLCFTPPDEDVAVAPLPAIANGRVTFGCANTLAKMNDDVVAVWARALAAVPGSCLLLKAKQLAEPSLRERVMERFAAHGVDAHRLVLEGPSPRRTYLEAYQRVDIALDPFPFPGGTTTAEALWMGVPVLTLAGERFLSRQGVGLMMNAGLPDWIATDPDAYVARAAAHAGDLPRLAALRGRLRQQVLSSPVFDAKLFARDFSAAMRGMWHAWCSRERGAAR